MSSVKDELHRSLNRRMGRKEFLQQLGLLLLAMLGVSQVIRVLTHNSEHQNPTALKDEGYGYSVYGGRRSI